MYICDSGWTGISSLKAFNLMLVCVSHLRLQTYSRLIAMASSGVNRLHVNGRLLRSYVPLSYVVYTAHSGAQMIRFLAGAVKLRAAGGLVTEESVGAEVFSAGLEYGSEDGSSAMPKWMEGGGE